MSALRVGCAGSGAWGAPWGGGGVGGRGRALWGLGWGVCGAVGVWSPVCRCVWCWLGFGCSSHPFPGMVGAVALPQGPTWWGLEAQGRPAEPSCSSCGRPCSVLGVLCCALLCCVVFVVLALFAVLPGRERKTHNTSHIVCMRSHFVPFSHVIFVFSPFALCIGVCLTRNRHLHG